MWAPLNVINAFLTSAARSERLRMLTSSQPATQRASRRKASRTVMTTGCVGTGARQMVTMHDANVRTRHERETGPASASPQWQPLSTTTIAASSLHWGSRQCERRHPHDTRRSQGIHLLRLQQVLVASIIKRGHRQTVTPVSTFEEGSHNWPFISKLCLDPWRPRPHAHMDFSEYS
jgi:hypothetical protein